MEDASDIAYHMPFLEECASKVGTVVEIGVGHGNGSTRAFSRGLERSTHFGKYHIGVDCDEERPQVKPSYSYWHEVHGSSEDINTRIAVQNILGDRYADIIFIDTIHTYEQMAQELPIWTRIAGPGTLWIFHDTWMFGVYNHMTEAIKEFATNGWEYLDQSRLAHGLGVLRHKEGPWGWITPREEAEPVPQV